MPGGLINGMGVRRTFARMGFFLFATLPIALSVQAQTREGVQVGETSVFAKMVPADQVERSAAQQYQQTLAQASKQRALGPADHPQVQRLRTIMDKIIPFASAWNPRAQQWKWEVNLIGSNQINAYCMPGGKIAFYTGILSSYN